MRKLICRLFGHRGRIVSRINKNLIGELYHAYDYCEYCKQKYPPGVI